jgi:hypothetical protein
MEFIFLFYNLLKGWLPPFITACPRQGDTDWMALAGNSFITVVPLPFWQSLNDFQ